MTTLTKELKAKSGDRKTYVEKIDKLFRIPPTSVKAKDGSGEILTIEHRVGAAAGTYTAPQLMAKLGFEQKYADFCATERRRYSDEKNWEIVQTVYYGYLRSQMYMALKHYRVFLGEMYANTARPLVPLMAFVPVGERRTGVYIQGFQDANSLKPLLFDKAADLLAWAEKEANSNRRSYRRYQVVQETLRASMTLPGINKDIEHAMKLMLQEPARLTHLG